MMKTAKDRLLQFIDCKKFTKHKFSKKNLLSNSFFNNKSAIGSDILLKIYRNFPELNMDWIVTGRGDMIFSETKDFNNTIMEGQEVNQITISELREMLEDKRKIISVLEAQVAAEQKKNHNV